MVDDKTAEMMALERAIRTYAIRIARKCFLECQCEEDHPVLINERHLVEMAKSKLQERLLANRMDPSKMASQLEAKIRYIAKLRISVLADAEDIRDAGTLVLEREHIEVFPPIH